MRGSKGCRHTWGTTCAYSWLQTTFSAVLSMAGTGLSGAKIATGIQRSAPFVKALEILDMAFPTEAAYSGGSSETLEQ